MREFALPNLHERELWTRIQEYDFEPDVVSNFTQRLARDKYWTLSFAREVILEYRRFCFVAVSGPGPATPSEQVDEAWHQHLTYTRNYWDIWCKRVLRAPLHHDPSAGGVADLELCRAQYSRTLARYETFFGSPPEAIWPATHTLFSGPPRFRTIDTHRQIPVWRPIELRRRFRRRLVKS